MKPIPHDVLTSGGTTHCRSRREAMALASAIREANQCQPRAGAWVKVWCRK